MFLLQSVPGSFGSIEIFRELVSILHRGKLGIIIVFRILKTTDCSNSVLSISSQHCGNTISEDIHKKEIRMKTSQETVDYLNEKYSYPSSYETLSPCIEEMECGSLI